MVHCQINPSIHSQYTCTAAFCKPPRSPTRRNILILHCTEEYIQQVLFSFSLHHSKIYLYTAHVIHIQATVPPSPLQSPYKADCSYTPISHASFDSIEPVQKVHFNSLQSFLLIQPIFPSSAILRLPATTNGISIALLDHTLQN